MKLREWIARLFVSQPATAQPAAADDDDDDMAALLVAAARADDQYTDTEAELITRILAAHCGIGAEEASAMRQRGEAAHAAATSDMFSFATRLKKRYGQAERLALLDGLWSVVLSDSERSPHEEALIRQSASILGLSNRDRINSRKRIEDRMAAPETGP